MRLSCGRFEIRSYLPEDAAAIVRHADNVRVAENLRDRFPCPYTDSDAEEWLAGALSQDPESNFAIATAEELIGTIGLQLGEDVYRHSAEIGYWLGEAYWGQGVATRAVEELTAWGFETFGLLRIFACVFEKNVASMRVLEKAGYELEARMRGAVVKNGCVMDQMVYARVSPGTRRSSDEEMGSA